MIKPITTPETYPIRSVVLRPNRPLSECYFAGDNDASTHHFGYFENDNLIGIVSVFKASFQGITAQNPFQIRGMAVLETHQHKKIGKKLMLYVEDFCQTQHTDFIWFNARTSAENFYKKLGYETSGNYFMIPDVCEHIVMMKNFK